MFEVKLGNKLVLQARVNKVHDKNSPNKGKLKFSVREQDDKTVGNVDDSVSAEEMLALIAMNNLEKV